MTRTLATGLALALVLASAGEAAGRRRATRRSVLGARRLRLAERHVREVRETAHLLARARAEKRLPEPLGRHLEACAAEGAVSFLGPLVERPMATRRRRETLPLVEAIGEVYLGWLAGVREASKLPEAELVRALPLPKADAVAAAARALLLLDEEARAFPSAALMRFLDQTGYLTTHHGGRLEKELPGITLEQIAPHLGGFQAKDEEDREGLEVLSGLLRELTRPSGTATRLGEVGEETSEPMPERPSLLTLARGTLDGGLGEELRSPAFAPDPVVRRFAGEAWRRAEVLSTLGPKWARVRRLIGYLAEMSEGRLLRGLDPAADRTEVGGESPAGPGEEPRRRRKGKPGIFLLAGFLLGAAVWWRRRTRPGLDREAPTAPVPGAETVLSQPDAPSASPVLEATHLVTGGGEPLHGTLASRDTVLDSGAPGVGASGAPAVEDKEGGIPPWLETALSGALGERFGEYQLLGAGGMGCVVRALDRRLERTVAIKVPPPHLATDEHFRARFLREAQAMGKLRHPNIVQVHDVPEVPEGRVPVMIMEYLEGEDLSARLGREGPLPVRDVLTWVKQAADALGHAHEAGILHRDVKPANILLHDGQVKLLDFGLAAVDDGAGLTRSGMLMGSLPYMPPEQLRGEKVGPEADVFSLAASAFQLLTGELPFPPEDTGRLEAPRVSEVRGDVPGEFDPVFEKALAPSPSQRYPSMKELLRGFKQAASGISRARSRA